MLVCFNGFEFVLKATNFSYLPWIYLNKGKGFGAFGVYRFSGKSHVLCVLPSAKHVAVVILCSLELFVFVIIRRIRNYLNGNNPNIFFILFISLLRFTPQEWVGVLTICIGLA